MLENIPNKREFLARRLQGLGLMHALERLARRPGLLVLTYHRIGTPSTNPFYDPVYSATPEGFEGQARYLRDHFRLLDLGELIGAAGSGFPWTEPTALLTFDDGYRDNAELAFPILAALGVPATFFLPTGFIGRPRLPWWDRIAYVLKQTRRPTLTLDVPRPMEIDLRRGGRSEAIWTVIRAFLDEVRVDEPAFLGHLERRAEVDVDPEALGRDLFLSWDDARRMAGAGMSFGSHSHDHPNLARLPEAEQVWELAQSRHILERELGREIAALAYPFGEADTYGEATKRLAREAGYRVAFSAEPGLNRPRRADPFALRRVAIGSSDTAPLFRARTVLYASFGSSIL